MMLRNIVTKALLLTMFAFAWLPAVSEAACTVTCDCYDRFGNSGSETQGPFQSRAACNSAVSAMSNRCTSASPGLMVSCGSCSACEPAASKAGESQVGNQAAEAKAKKLKAAEKMQQQKAFDQQKGELLGTMKGASPAAAPNSITLKPIPPRSPARTQLDCVARGSSKAATDSNSNEAASSKSMEGWDSAANDCAPVEPQVPAPLDPTLVEMPADPAQLATYLETLGKRISSSRESMAMQDRKIAEKQDEVTKLELKAAGDPKKPDGESDALRRAREALEKARADRARTAAELAKLEQQQAAAKEKLPTQER